MNWYCDIAPENEWHAPYHALEYGFPVKDDKVYFERLCLEIFQAGLSWLTVLKKRQAFNEAFDGFDYEKIALYDDRKISELLENKAIIRNRLKINAVIYNAGKFIEIIGEHGSFDNWLCLYHPLEKQEWVKLFKKNFKFTGGEIVGEFLMSTGYLKGAHRKSCPVYEQIEKLSPPWLIVDKYA